MHRINIFNYEDYRDFLFDVVKHLCGEEEKQSQRWLFLRIKWPISLYADVMKKRRNLSIARTLELGFFMELEFDELEYFLTLVMLDSHKVAIRRYAKLRLSHVLK